MLKTLKTLDLPTPAPVKRAVDENLKKVEKSHDNKSTDKISEKKKDKKDEFAATLENELNEVEADAGVAQVEESDLEAKVLGNGIVKSELQASAGLKAQPLSMDAISTEMSAPVSTEPTPQILDSKLIKQVNDVILPEGVEQTQVEGAPVTMQELIGQPKGQGRAPAIDFAKSEVDPKLMNMEDFVSQKNIFTKQPMNPQAYGMPTKGMLNPELKSSSEAKKLQEGLDAILKNDAAPVVGLTAAALSVEGIGQNEKADMGVNGQQKVFDLNSLKGQKLDAENVMSQITDYVVQARAAKEPTVNLKMNHQDLGLIDITVNRSGNNMVSIALGAQDQNVKTFLGQHRESLLGHLSQSGISVTDLKVELQSASRDNASNHQHASTGHGQSQQFGSEQNQRRQEQQRREDLWNVLREKEVA